MTETIIDEAVVPAELDGQRFDQLAAHLFPDFSRSRLQTWIKSGQLLVNNSQRKPKDKLETGDILSLNVELEGDTTAQAEPIPLNIVYEDDALLVINKPAGLVVHPAAGHASGTLLNGLLHHLPEIGHVPRCGIVHRLDKETSGLMVVAKTLSAQADLVEQLQSRSVSRTYEAVCVGVMTGGGTVDQPMGRHPRDRKKMAVLDFGGKEAITHYRVVKRFAHHTHVRVNLETGRTHQIRVHMAHMHYPLVGDPVYGGRPKLPRQASEALVVCLRGFGRQALHASALELEHPDSGDTMVWNAALPDDMQDLLATLASEDV